MVAAGKSMLAQRQTEFSFDSPLFADSEPPDMAASQGSSRDARRVLTTSFAEVAMPIPDVDVVLNTGTGRWTSYDEVPTRFDGVISDATIKQREGRVARTKPGTMVAQNHGEPAGLKCLGATERSVRNTLPLTFFQEATGSGKSNVRPHLHSKLLVLTPAAKDVRDIA